MGGRWVDGLEHTPSRTACLSFLSVVLLCALTLGWGSFPGSSRGAAPLQWSLTPLPQAESELHAEAGGKRMAWRELGVDQSHSGKS